MGQDVKNWVNGVIRHDEVDRFMKNGHDFINDEKIWDEIRAAENPDKNKIRDIIAKSLSIERLSPSETAALLAVQDPELWQEMKTAAGEVKRRVYDNRIVTFAPLYCSSFCVNNCTYCGFRKDNDHSARHTLTREQVIKETEAMVRLGHKKAIVVYGEHPVSDVRYIAETIDAIYSVRIPTRHGTGNIRRVNVNAAPMSIADLRELKKSGIGTYQVFQETYHHDTYKKVHPSGIKSHYGWRLTALHRAQEAGVDDVAIGALFGLYDWRFEVMGLLYHAIDLENRFGGVGPHTISFPRIKPADGISIDPGNPYAVNDEDFEKLITVIRLSVPYTGMIVTAREPMEVRRRVIGLGCTQTDASTRIGVGAYSEAETRQESDRQQFMLGDTRGLEEVIRDFASMGLITSFCTAGYRCGRTGTKIMGMLKKGLEAKFCKTNAVLTFREWLDDYASPETVKACEGLLNREISEIRRDPFFQAQPALLAEFENYYRKIAAGERDLYI